MDVLMIAPTRDEMRSLGCRDSPIAPTRYNPFPGREQKRAVDSDPDPPQEQKRPKIETEISELEVQISSNPDLVKDLERRAGFLEYGMNGRLNFECMMPDKEFYLLSCRYKDRDLYSRLVVNIMGTREYDFPVSWSQDPTTDLQYVQLYKLLLDVISDQIPSWADLFNKYNLYGDMPNYEIVAFEHGKKFPKLTFEDIRECTTDFIRETSLQIPHLKLSRDFHHYLLENKYKENGYKISERCVNYDNWKNDDKTPFVRWMEAKHFERWLTKENIDKLDTLDEKIRKLDEYHKKLSDEDCSTRIRYVTLKLKLAKKLGIISKTAQLEFAMSR